MVMVHGGHVDGMINTSDISTYFSNATDEREWPFMIPTTCQQHVNGLEKWNWTGILTRAQWVAASAHPNRTDCMHTWVSTISSSHELTYPLFFAKQQKHNIPYHFIQVNFTKFAGWWFQPLWKIWVRPLGWWHSQAIWKVIKVMLQSPPTSY